MRKIFFWGIFISVVITNFFLVPNLYAENNPLMSPDEQQKKNNTIQMTHHIVWVMAVLKNSNFDSRDLELQYNQLLASNISFDSLNEYTKPYLNNMLTEIKNLRIDQRERELLDEIYKDEQNRAFWACLPRNMAVLVDFDWRQVVANVVQTIFYSAMNYQNIKSALAIQYKKDSWNLDRQRLEQVTKKHSRDIDDLFNIFKNKDMNILDREIVKEADSLCNKVAEVGFGNSLKPAKRFKVWKELTSKALEDKYQNFALYWYYRGILAYYYQKDEKNQKSNVKLVLAEGSNLPDAKKCFERFQKLTQTPVLSKDPIVAEVAARRIQLEISLNEKVADSKFLREQLAIIEHNSVEDKDFERYLFCGLIYYKYLNDYSYAEKMFQNAESILASKFRKDIAKFIKVLDIDNDYDVKKEFGDHREYIKEKVEIFQKNKENGKLETTMKKQKVYFPIGDVLFFAKMAGYHSAIKAQNDIALVDEINKTITHTASPLATLFYAANVKEAITKRKYYMEILPKVFGLENPYPCDNFLTKYVLVSPIGEYGLPYPIKHLQYYWRFGEDHFYAKMPLAFAYLTDVEYSMEIHTNDGKVISMTRDADKDELETLPKPVLKEIYSYFYDEEKKIIDKKRIAELPLPPTVNYDNFSDLVFGKKGNRLVWNEHYDVLLRIGFPTIKILRAFKCEEDKLPPNAEYIVFKVKHDLFEYSIKYDISSRNGQTKDAYYYGEIPGKIYFKLNEDNVTALFKK